MSDDIKVTGTPQTFGDGAVRNTKEGKGRFDLIPPEPFYFILDRIHALRNENKPYIDISNENVWKCAFVDSKYVDVIIALTIRGYTDAANGFIVNQQHNVSLDLFSEGVWKMLQALAIHFQKGAEIYGEHNCEKGIPNWSFRDSGLRHTAQYFSGLTDEPHLISAIWNFWMLIWSSVKDVPLLDEYKWPDFETSMDIINKHCRKRDNYNE